VARAAAASEANHSASQYDVLLVIARVEELQARVDSLQADNGRLRMRIDSLEDAERHRGQDRRSPPYPTVSAAVDPGGAPVDESGRRLTSSSTFIGVDALQVHELPSGHTCANTGFVESHPRLLTVDSGGPSVAPGPTVASADVSFASVDAKDYTVSEIQRIAAPMKVVHASDCSTAPTLNLQLSTTVASLAVSTTLTVGSTNIGSSMGALTASLSWTALVLDPAFQDDTTSGSGSGYFAPGYSVRNGMVYLRGRVTTVTGEFTESSSGANPRGIARLPVGARPSKYRMLVLPAAPHAWVRLAVTSSGQLRVMTANSATTIYLDMAFFPLD